MHSLQPGLSHDGLSALGTVWNSAEISIGRLVAAEVRRLKLFSRISLLTSAATKLAQTFAATDDLKPIEVEGDVGVAPGLGELAMDHLRGIEFALST